MFKTIWNILIELILRAMISEFKSLHKTLMFFTTGYYLLNLYLL